MSHANVEYFQEYFYFFSNLVILAEIRELQVFDTVWHFGKWFRFTRLHNLFCTNKSMKASFRFSAMGSISPPKLLPSHFILDPVSQSSYWRRLWWCVIAVFFLKKPRQRILIPFNHQGLQSRVMHVFSEVSLILLLSSNTIILKTIIVKGVWQRSCHPKYIHIYFVLLSNRLFRSLMFYKKMQFPLAGDDSEKDMSIKDNKGPVEPLSFSSLKWVCLKPFFSLKWRSSSQRIFLDFWRCCSEAWVFKTQLKRCTYLYIGFP